MTERNPIAYVSDGARALTPSADELRSRIPGWGADLDPADRPSTPKLDPTLRSPGAQWDFPDRQPGGEGRERSIEHAFLTPVFGTAAPLRGASGALRRFAYRYSEGRAAHWLLLIVGDRVDALGSSIIEAMRGRPDNPLAETGIGVERGSHPVASRWGAGRSDLHHTWIDPLIVGAPWLLGAYGVFRVVRTVGRRLTR